MHLFALPAATGATRQLLLVASLLLASGPGHAATEVDLKWDLSYRTALAKHPIASNEFMQYWLADKPLRPIHTKLAEYVGEPIEASLLIERPDGHAGDPDANWFVKTRSGASVCTFHQKFMQTPCERLDPVRAEQFMRAVLHWPALPPQSGNTLQGKGADGRPILLNYVGFLSVFVDGVALQRPIAASEVNLSATGADPQAGRLDDALARLVLSDADLQKRQGQLDAAARQQSLNEATIAGDPALLRTLLDQEGGNAPDVTALLALAAANGRHRALDFLLTRGAQIDADESAALKAAVTAGDAEMVSHLLERGAHVDPPPPKYGAIYQSALGLAVHLHKSDMARLLLARGAQVNLAQTRTVLGRAVSSRDLAMVELILKAGAKPDQGAPGDARTPLMLLMVSSGRLGGWPTDLREQQAIARTEAELAPIARRLVAAGANANAITPTCHTAYLEAYDRHSEAMKNLLQSLGADPALHRRCHENRQRGVQGPSR